LEPEGAAASRPAWLCYRASVGKKRTKARGTSAGGAEDDDAPRVPAPTGPVTTGLGALLERAGLKTLPPAKPAAPKAVQQPSASGSRSATPGVHGPLPTVPEPLPRPVQPPSPKTSPKRAASKSAPVLSTADLSAWNRAMGGVQPLRRKSPRAPAPPPPIAAAPAALASSAEDDAARARLDALVGGGVRFEVRWDEQLVQAVRQGGSDDLPARTASAGFVPEAQLDLHRVRAGAAQRAVTDFVRTQHRRGVRRLLVIVGKGLHSEDGHGVLARAAVAALTEGVAAPLVNALSSAHAKHGGAGALAVLLR
jgi:DNA-nicking Smr family endonuclease